MSLYLIIISLFPKFSLKNNLKLYRNRLITTKQIRQLIIGNSILTLESNKTVCWLNRPLEGEGVEFQH
jgi:hypothetical protein